MARPSVTVPPLSAYLLARLCPCMHVCACMAASALLLSVRPPPVLSFDVDPQGRGVSGGAEAALAFFEIDFKKVEWLGLQIALAVGTADSLGGAGTADSL